jgi:peroxiredoxin
MRRSCLALLLALLAGLVPSTAPARAEDGPNVAALNKKIQDFTLPDTAGKPVSLSRFAGKSAVVVVFLSFECPVSSSYTPLLADLARTYEPRGVVFLAINSSDDTTPAELGRQAKSLGLPFPVLRDEKCRAADAFKAETVPSAFLLDSHLVLRYCGRIDDGYSARLRRNPRPAHADLREALDDLLGGKEVRRPATSPVGCPIVRPREAARSGKVTYYRDVLPILQANCQSCHRPGEVGPFSLLTCKQAVRWAADIKDFTQQHRMPPWKPVEGGPFRNERRLSERDIATLAAWVDGGTPEGDPKDAPPPIETVADREGWRLGKPDLVLTLPDEMTVGASGLDLFRCFVLPTGLTEDRYVKAVEVRPGNRRVVHHALLFWDGSGKGRELEKQARTDAARTTAGQDQGPGYTASMGVGFVAGPGQLGTVGGWAPGQVPTPLPAGHGYFLPKGSDIILQLHYHRNGRAEKDRTTVGLYLARDRETKPYKSMVIAGRFFLIPAGERRHTVRGAIEVDQDCLLHSVMPHMHLLGREVRVTLTPPSGKPQTLLAIKDWDYNWQETYFLKEPIALKKGTRLAVEAVYDNSAANPNNPFSPPRWVRLGDQTTDEMCFIFLGATCDRPGRLSHRVNDTPDEAKKEEGKKKP